MEGSLKDLSDYRLERAKEDLDRAKREFEFGDYKLAQNRSYYAVFHAMRAVNALDDYDSRKHSGVISHFNHEHVKNGDFPKEVSKMIKGAMEVRQQSDYEDFYVVSREFAEKQLQNVEYIISLIDDYLKTK
jgi:uncharacterized protein (UPF0332 family)